MSLIQQWLVCSQSAETSLLNNAVWSSWRRRHPSSWYGSVDPQRVCLATTAALNNSWRSERMSGISEGAKPELFARWCLDLTKARIRPYFPNDASSAMIQPPKSNAIAKVHQAVQAGNGSSIFAGRDVIGVYRHASCGLRAWNIAQCPTSGLSLVTA